MRRKHDSRRQKAYSGASLSNYIKLLFIYVLTEQPNRPTSTNTQIQHTQRQQFLRNLLCCCLCVYCPATGVNNHTIHIFDNHSDTPSNKLRSIPTSEILKCQKRCVLERRKLGNAISRNLN
jgi:hypothetical protein